MTALSPTRNRRVSLLWLALGLLLLLVSLPTWAAPTPGTVTLLIWEDFLSPKVIKLLKTRHGLDIQQITFTSPTERDQLLLKHAGQIDIVVADTVGLSGYRTRGLLERIDGKRVPNLKHVLMRWQADMGYAVPYLWGQTGIAWRTDKVKKPITTYAQLLAFAHENPGKVSLLDDAHEALMAARYAAGINDAIKNPDDVTAAKKLLDQYLPDLRIVGSILDRDAPLVTGEVIAAQAYNGDVAYLRDTYNAPLAFATPSPGCMIWQEHLLLLRNAPHKVAAYAFLNQINDPEIAARNANEVRYATSNALAINRLDAKFRSDPIIHPTFDGLENCYFYPAFNNATQRALKETSLHP